MKRALSMACLVGLVSSMALAGEYYTDPQVYGMRPKPTQEKDMGPIGPTGIFARIYKGMRIKVERVEPGTPAEGKFKKGDLLLTVNGTAHKGKNPFVVFGTAITQAEATDGVLTFGIQEEGSAGTKKVTLKIPVLGEYSETYPLECEKSATIIKRAAEYYARADGLKRRDLWDALTCLFLLSTGDDAYVPRVKEYLAKFLKPDGRAKDIGTHSWFNGYNGIVCAEYYLRTGDKSVLPILQYYCDDAKERQKYGLGWGHWGYHVFPSYEKGGGVMHGAGNQVLATLVLGKLCGVDVDDKTLLGALRHWYRFAGHGAVSASDQRPFMLLRSAGRDGVTAALMHIASMAEGDTTIYKEARNYLGLSAMTSWPARNFDWELYWHNLGGQFARESRPDIYQNTMDRFRWRYDIGRMASGGFYWPDGRAPEPSGGGICLALAYTAPLKTLQITGAPRSEYASKFTLPENLWGNEADRAFLSTEHHPDYLKYGEENDIHVPFWQLRTTRLFYKPKDVKDVPLQDLQKNVRHWRLAIREAAAKTLAFNGHFDEIERLLVDDDPRLRRAGLEGIYDCTHWFLNPVVGEFALKSEQYTPAMIRAIEAMLANPDEAWYVTDGALQALSNAPIEVIERNTPRITPWLKHEEWWLRHSAFNALMGLSRNKELFASQLPALIDTMVKEYHWNPRHKMVLRLKDEMVKTGTDSPIGKMIIAGLTRAAVESEVKYQEGPYPKQDEGLISILEVAHIAMKGAPESAYTIGESIARSGQMKSFGTQELVRLVKSNDGYYKDKFLGMLPALEHVEGENKERLTELLLETYRPELIRRCAEPEAVNMEMLILLSELAVLGGDAKGWQPLAASDPAEQEWRFHSFDVIKESEKLGMRAAGWHRLRFVTLPEGLDKWFEPEFNDAKWDKGKAPIGVGRFTAHGHGQFGRIDKPRGFAYENRSDWGEKEFLLARSTFTVDDTDFDYFRLRALAEHRMHVWLNGERIFTSRGGASFPIYQTILLDANTVKKALKKGKNTIAVYAVVRYEQDRGGDGFHPIGQLDLWLEGLKKTDIGLD